MIDVNRRCHKYASMRLFFAFPGILSAIGMFRQPPRVDCSLAMARTMRIFFALLITISAAASLGGTGKRTLVEFWHTGDDGLSQKLADQVEGAFARSPDFTLSRGQQPGAMIVTIQQIWTGSRSVRERGCFIKLNSISNDRETLPASVITRAALVLAKCFHRGCLGFYPHVAISIDGSLGERLR